ncbi:MAG: hypothetical protein NTX66_02670, partial [Candidatus Falkowbacteria bacterium]|nr:hypothetical protein [Candidatus Falkowbacteria bacterium]
MNKKVKKYLKVGARATGILFLLLSINEPAIALTADASKTIAVSPTIIETTGPEIAATPIPNNSPVKLHGFVLSLPGQFGSQYFYLYNNQEVVQIYNYWKKFPDFKINDYLEVAATFSAQTKIKRFKTKETTDIRSLKNISSDPRAKPLSAAELNSLTPNFVSLSGKIGALKKSSFYLRYQDKETLVDLKNLINFDLSELKIDDELKVNGLLFNDAGTSRL